MIDEIQNKTGLIKSIINKFKLCGITSDVDNMCKGCVDGERCMTEYPCRVCTRLDWARADMFTPKEI